MNTNYNLNDDGLNIILDDYFEIKVSLPEGLESNFTAELTNGGKANLVINTLILKLIFN